MYTPCLNAKRKCRGPTGMFEGSHGTSRGATKEVGVEYDPSCPHGQWGLKLCASKPTQRMGGPSLAV